MWRILAVLSAAALTLSACSGGDESEGSGDDGGPSVTIAEPADGAGVEAPFDIVVESSEELGPTDTGNHHVHVYFDGDDSAYEVVETGNGEPFEITADSPALEGLEPGEHTLNVSLRNADHSAAGAEDEITIDLGGTGTGDGGEEDDDGGGLGY